MQQGTPISMPSMPTPGFPVMDLTPGQGPGGVLMPSLPPTPAGVSFIIQIGLTRESVLMPQTADLAYVKQIACSIVDTKVGNVCVFLCVCVCVWREIYFLWLESCLCKKLCYACFPPVFQMTSLSCTLVFLFCHSLFLCPTSLSKNSLFTLYYSHR